LDLKEKIKNNAPLLTNRQPSNAGYFRRFIFIKPANDNGKQNEQQVNPALRLPAFQGNFQIFFFFFTLQILTML
jgi:hypothetical protein